jgi:two-component system nitrogen regulation response regulator NtrX
MAQRILLIDDEPEFRSTLADVLERGGYDVHNPQYLASSVGIGLTGGYDLITLDLKMPEVDGLEVARLYARMLPETPILVISGYLDDHAVSALGEMGLTHYLDKPAGVTELLDAVGHALTAAIPKRNPTGSSTNGHASGHANGHTRHHHGA